jgi:SagB-type dehydrogenase family enzyme
MTEKGKGVLIVSLFALILIFLAFEFWNLRGEKDRDNEKMNFDSKEIKLPEPDYRGEISVEEAILERRSSRNYKDESLTLKEVSQLLWAAQGITGKDGFKRAAPSAGATYPLEVFLIAGEVKDLPAGIYRYKTQEHWLLRIVEEDARKKLAEAALGQNFIEDAPLSIVFTAVYERTTSRYGERGIRYVHMEGGHTAQNIYLECESLGLGTVVVGAFRDEEVKAILNLEQEVPLYIMPVGRA